MRVRCIKIIAQPEGELDYHPAVCIGAEYDVISIDCVPARDPLFQIYCDAGGPSWWSSRMFVITSSKIFANWRINIVDEGIVVLGPDAFLEQGYWDRFFDDNPEAIQTFEEEFLRFRQDADG